MRVGVATNWKYPDYGGMIQAYATQVVLEDLGCKPEMLDCEKLQGDIDRRKLRYFARNLGDRTIVAEKAGVALSAVRRHVPGAYRDGMVDRRAAFRSFSADKFTPSRSYDSWEEIADATHDYDCVLVGSDQLWLPSNIYGDYYTLSFVPDDVRKVNYATSFGVGSMPEYLRDKAKRFLDRFAALSARETTGMEIICDHIGVDVPLVCDPTLLLLAEKWSGISSDARVPDEQYIFCYLMGDNSKQREAILELKRMTGWKILQLPHLDRYIATDEGFADLGLYDVGPADFLGLIEHATFVCTDSFHGTIFSSIFNRPFLVFPRFTRRATLSTNTRIATLLDRLSINDRLVGDGVAPKDFLDRELDYERLNNAMTSFRGESLVYLRNALRVAT